MTDAPQTRAEAVAEERRNPARAMGIGVQGDPTLRRFGVPDNLLDFDKYEYRSALDDRNRLYELVEQGEYEFVTLSDRKAGKSLKSDDAGVVKAKVGNKVDGSPAYAYLVRKLKKFADEDRKQAVAKVDAQEKLQLQGQTKDAPDQSYTPKR